MTNTTWEKTPEAAKKLKKQTFLQSRMRYMVIGMGLLGIVGQPRGVGINPRNG